MLKQFLVAFTTFLAIDGLWLTLIAKNFYAKHLGFLMAKTPNLTAALIFYLIYVFTMVVLIITPALQKGSLTTAILTGALFGLCAYATYDLTNLATIKDWPLLVTIVDLIWGTVLSGAVAGISYLVLTKLL
ncbi:MAG: hypothetical protein UT13_C0001G0372 [Candidatus Pacebacteria bacterium GW2011_GWF2_38_9]|nr:MAG: hypothetical protein US01_C0001G0382 [candidate division TM6 bacterium GW2011_GWF2_28_16]KKQ08467.1 MAG: hypothetical protein US20_C0016G0012 [Candidatus Pacebacteria bacterium GW2011_GWF1_36_5]KKQ88725.1 MAG: hypothetical protein UT13_C0001G0372 [Candidatus Pacebacteria bacterium GW2011_GWF2_38_9]HAZ73742.1 DUF2177 domain-containing protein [Candidatus Paceibacterota bacterium]